LRLATRLVIAAALFAACGSPAPTASPRGPAAVTLALPTLPGGVSGTPAACAGIGLESVLHGDPADPRVAWLEPFAGAGPRLDLVWPAGYSARFAPDLEVLDERGNIAIRAGDFVDSGCVTANAHILALEPPFLSLKLTCGPFATSDCTSSVFQAATQAGWPARDIVGLRFQSRDGRFQATFADGGVMSGIATQP
jgi:hypothetical protein